MGTLSLLTYNLLYGRAFRDLLDYLKAYKPDIVVVQEFKVGDEEFAKMEEAGYLLADYSHSFFKHFKFYSIATFYNPDRLEHKNGEAVSLARGAYEFLLFLMGFGKTERTALYNHFIVRSTGREVEVCNLHLTPLTGTNRVRNNQLTTAINHLDKNSLRPAIVVGDFNYPYNRKGLERLFQSDSFLEATDNLYYTYENTILGLIRFKAKTDYILYKGMKKKETTRLDRKRSDHFPILAEFTL